MALSNKERQKKWLEKNRALHNFRRRKKNLPVPVLAVPASERSQSASRIEQGGGWQNTLSGSGRGHKPAEPAQALAPSGRTDAPNLGGRSSALPAQTSKEDTLARLRSLVKQEEEKPEARVRSDVVGGVYRNDSGGVITKFAWEKLQKMKEKAKDGGYTLDEYSQ